MPKYLGAWLLPFPHFPLIFLSLFPCPFSPAIPLAVKVKVKFSHTRYRALGPELIPVYRQSARM